MSQKKRTTSSNRCSELRLPASTPPYTFSKSLEAVLKGKTKMTKRSQHRWLKNNKKCRRKLRLRHKHRPQKNKRLRKNS
jgi:hypothetical protein